MEASAEPVAGAEARPTPSMPPSPSARGDNGSAITAHLTIQTIMEQQRIINSLQELVSALKNQVRAMEIEKINSVPPPPVAVVPKTMRRGMEELRHQNSELQLQLQQAWSEKEVLELRCQGMQTVISELNHITEDFEALTEKHAERESYWERQKVLMHLTENRCRQLEVDSSQLHEDFTQASFHTRRWISLVNILSERLDAQLQPHLANHIRKMMEEEHAFSRQLLQRREEREKRATAEQQAENTHRHGTSPDAFLPLGEGGARTPPPMVEAHHPVDILAFWNAVASAAADSATSVNEPQNAITSSPAQGSSSITLVGGTGHAAPRQGGSTMGRVGWSLPHSSSVPRKPVGARTGTSKSPGRAAASKTRFLVPL